MEVLSWSPIVSVLEGLVEVGMGRVADAAIGAAVVAISVFVVPRRLWRLHGAQGASVPRVLVSYRPPEETPAYSLPVTGKGQLDAVGAFAPSLVRSYGWRWRRPLSIVPAVAGVGARDLGGNLILLGGPMRNAVTEMLLERRGDSVGVRQQPCNNELYGDRLFLRTDGAWKPFGGTPRRADGEPGSVTVD